MQERKYAGKERGLPFRSVPCKSSSVRVGGPRPTRKPRVGGTQYAHLVCLLIRFAADLYSRAPSSSARLYLSM